jgi:hypothetical protein
MILNKNNLVENVLNELSDNSTGQISPYSIRHNLLDIIDSVHLLTGASNLAALNFSTPETRTTKAGSLTLEKLNLDGYSTVDNSAFGYSALKANYQGSKNTAIGSFALSCNLFGEDNAALGFHSLAGNTTGFANVGLGNFSLNNNRIGNFNIAIGHGAGYYVTRDTNNQLFIASHPVNDDYICANPLGSGLKPLIRGDLSNLRLAIATNDINPYGTLQIAGHTTPSLDNIYDLGLSSYRFRYSNLSSGIKIGNNFSLDAFSSGVSLSGNLYPRYNKVSSLGSPSLTWLEGHFENLYVSGIARINDYIAIRSCEYANKTLYLASSGDIDGIDGGGPFGLLDYFTPENQAGHPCGYLNDSQLLDAGIIIKSSGVNYQRDYKFTYAPPNPQEACQQSNSPYAQSSWNSNISLHLDSGSHIKTDRIITYNDLSIVTPSSCYGLNLNNDEHVYFSRTNILSRNPANSNGHLAGIGNVNFLANSGDSVSNYFINVAAIESGVTVGQRFLTGTKRRIKDINNNNKDKLNGFEIKYVDDSNLTVIGSLTDRLIIGSYNNTSYMKNSLILMKDNDNGMLGLNNLSPTAEDTLPKTTFNIRSTSNAIIRVTAENVGNVVSSLQLLGVSNCLNDGCELQYYSASGFADLSIYKDSGKVPFIRSYENNSIGIFTGSGISNSMITFGDKVYTDAVLSLHATSGTPSSTVDYGKLFIKPKLRTYQSQSTYLLDSSGNIHDLVVNKYDVYDARGLYTDVNGNTFGGYLCPSGRENLTSIDNNTAIGYKSLYGITTGDQNTVLGSNASSGLTTGSKNIVIGYNAAPQLTSTSNNIFIGNDQVANGLTGNYNFILGASSGNVLLQGKSGPTNSDKYLEMPSGGKFTINNIDNSEAISFKNNIIEVVDRGGSAYPDNVLTFKFTGNNSANLLTLSHNANPMTNNFTYKTPSIARPFAQFDGDIKLRGAIRFSDETSLDSASFLNRIDVVESGLIVDSGRITYLERSTIEGYVPNEIVAPNNITSPTSGIFIVKDKNWNNIDTVYLSNRDTSSFIHSGAYVVAVRVNGQFRPVWVSATTCDCCPRS